MAEDFEKRITAKMVLDSTGFNSSIQGVNSQLKLAQSELKASSQQLGVFGSQTDKLRATTESLNQQIELQRQKVDIYKESIDKTTEKLQANIKARDELKQSLVEANAKYAEAVKQYGKESEEAAKAKQSVDQLTEEYKKKEKQIDSNAKSINNYTIKANQANAELANMQGELQKTNTELDKSNNNWIKASDTLKASSDKMKTAGESMSKAGDGLLKISAPFITAGVASSKFAIDFQDAMAKVSTISDDTQVPLEKLGQGVLKLSDDTGVASTEIANNIYDAISAGQSTADSVNFVTNSTKLAKAGFAEAGQSLDLLTTILNAYKLKSSEVVNVSDLLIQVQNKGKVTVGELSADMGKLIPTAVATNTSLQQLGAGYAIMTSNGIKSAESTTYMNSMLNELSKTGTNADKALRQMSGQSFSELMANGKSLGDVLSILNEYAEKNKLSLKDMFGSAEAGKAALVLSTNAGNDFNNMLKDMNDVTGATDTAFEKVNNTSGARLNKSLNELKNNAIKLGESLLPIVDSVSGIIGTLADKIGQLDEGQVKAIASLALFTAGLGGVLKIGGGIVSTVGSITGVAGKFASVLGTATIATEAVGTASTVAVGAAGAGGMAGLAASFGAAAVAAAPFVVAGAAVVGTGYLINKEMSEEVIPTVDLFANKVEMSAEQMQLASASMGQSIQTTSTKISEETQKAVGAYLNLDKQTSQSLTNLFVNSSTITAQTATDMVGKYSNMANQIKTGMDSHHQQLYTDMQAFFANSKSLSDTEEKEALAKLQQDNASKKAEIDKYTQEIQAILKKASDEKRALTLEEQQQINEIQDKMKVNAVKSLSDSEVESKVILERLKEYGTRITAEQASGIIANAEKQRKESVEKANQQYDQTVKSIIRMRDETGVITAAQADKMIADAQRQKEESIVKAGELKDGVVEKIKSMNSEVLQDIDTTDGGIMTKWDKLKEWFANNPIIRWIRTMSEDSSGDIGHNWTGTTNWRGGLTTLNERGYELYDLPQGTRVFNHEASQDLVMKTAQSVARQIAKSLKGGGETINIYGNITLPNVKDSYDWTSQLKQRARLG